MQAHLEVGTRYMYCLDPKRSPVVWLRLLACAAARFVCAGSEFCTAWGQVPALCARTGQRCQCLHVIVHLSINVQAMMRALPVPLPAHHSHPPLHPIQASPLRPSASSSTLSQTGARSLLLSEPGHHSTPVPMHWEPPVTHVQGSSFVNPYLPPHPASTPDQFSISAALPPPACPHAAPAAVVPVVQAPSLVPVPTELQVGPTLVQDATLSRPTTASSMMDDDEVNELLGWTDNLPE